MKNVINIWDEARGKYVGIPSLKGEKGDKGDKGDSGQIENIDQTYNSDSENAQSGIAVAEAVTEAKDYIDTKIGDIDTALDSIIALQNSYIGGNS